MRQMMVALCCLLAVGAHPALADTLPAYCGAVGAKSYTPPTVIIPPVVLNRGTVITVTNATVAVNGDTSSVAALVANPGPDGISIQEAIMATNNDPGTWNIQFAPALKGSIIDTGNQGLIGLTGGNVTINGDIDGDGQPDITLTTSLSTGSAGVTVYSGGNTLYALALQNFWYGVWIGPAGWATPVIGATFSNTTVSNLVLTGIQFTGIGVNPPSPWSADCQSNWDHILITGNTISGNAAGPALGIDLALGSTAGGDMWQHTTIANNNIVLPMPGARTVGIAMNVGTGLGAMNNQALDTLIANNIISVAGGTIGIRIAAGGGAASASLMDGMRVIGNQINPVTGGLASGIDLVTGDAASDDADPSLRPIQYSENNIARNIAILSNTIGEAGCCGIFVVAACCGNANNTIDNLSILGNTLTGMQLIGGASADYYSRPSTGNMLSNVLVQANTIHSSPLPPPPPSPFPPTLAGLIPNGGGIYVIAGLGAPGNSVNGISIANNDVNSQMIGINIIGGWDHPPPSGVVGFSADNNVVSAAQIFCNQMDQAATADQGGNLYLQGVGSINVAAGITNANGNQVQQLYIADNLVAGVLGNPSLFTSLGDGASGNTLTTSASPTPAISFVANAEGASTVIAPNTWIAVYGVNLAPHQDALNVRIWGLADFVNDQMPTQLDGVSVTVNGESAFVYYVSPSQVNILTPPDAMQGPVNAVVTNNGALSQAFVAQAQPVSPSFFVFDGTHVVATHADGTDIGPTTLYPGWTTPAKPGETIVIYANGFGPTSTPVVSGAVSQSGSLSPMPAITIGGIQANVRFAGLNVTPGEFQFNVDVPVNLTDGDQPITATFSGGSTQAGALLTVQH